jgi:hypothetical protein
MCCLFTTLVLLGPRFGVLIWWLFDPARWNLAFDLWVWPLLGALFVPWTTLMYVIVFPGGVDGLDWLWLGLGLFADIGSWSGGAWGNRRQVSSYIQN